jgi:hypothetical protein
MKICEYESAVDLNTPKGYPNLVAGWPDEEHGIDWESYIDWAHDVMDNVAEGDDIGTLQTFDQFKEQERKERPDRDDLGFSHIECELCGALPGDRHAVTAYPEDMTASLSDGNYCPLSVCGDCLQYVVNGEFPDWLED